MVTAIVTLAQAKAHLRVTQNAEDDLITLYVAAAQDAIRNWINRSIPGEDDSGENFPFALQAAALLLVGGMYENRADVFQDTRIEANPAVERLIYPFRTEIGI